MVNGHEDEQCLIDAARGGDTAAFGQLVRRYQDRLFPTMLRLTGRAEDAMDLSQDAFLRAYQKLGRFHGDSSFYTWLYRIAVNLALSQRRRRRPTGGMAGGWGDTMPEPTERVDHSDPSIPLQRVERDEMIQKALNALAPEHRVVVVLKDLDGLRYEEIAVTLGIPIGTVRSRLHRARLELRERLRDLVEDQPVRVQRN